MNRRRLYALLLGLATVLVVFEIVLRLTGAFERQFWQVEGRDVHSDKPVVLFVGNSHTMGSGAPKDKSFPNQLAARLTARNHGTMPFEFVNVGRGNANSSFIVESLPAFLAKYHPSYVVVMTGETNQWNHYGYANFVNRSSKPSPLANLYELAYHIRVFRFVQLFNEFVVKPRTTQVFSSQKESDRALFWISALDNSNMFDISKMTTGELTEARRVLEKFIRENPEHVGALMASSDVYFKSTTAEDLAAGYRNLRKAYEINGEHYNFSIDRTLNFYLRDSQRPVEIEKWAHHLKDRRPKDFKLFIEFFDGLRTPKSLLEASVERRLAFFGSAVDANPTNSIARTVLYNQQIVAKRYAEGLQTLMGGAALNPFSNMMDWYATMQQLRETVQNEKEPNQPLVVKIDAALESFKARYPEHADSSRLISQAAIARWLASDLEAIAKLVRNAHAELMLQTYMPEKSGFEKPANAVIRKFADRHGIPISDTAKFFFRIEPDPIKRQRFFTTWYGEFDNHLGENGYAVISELLEQDFEKAGWIPKTVD
jgi:hypothetical protein